MSTNNDFIVVITNRTGDYISPFNKENLYCFEPLYQILKYNLQEYCNIPDENFFSEICGVPEDKENLPVLLILQDCFDITKKSVDGIIEEYKSAGNIEICTANKKIIAKMYKSGNSYFKNHFVSYVPVLNFRELRERNQKAQKDIIKEYEEKGVQFVSLDGAGISPFAKIEPGAVIYQGTIIRGKSHIGKNTVLGPNTLIENSDIGDNCIINSAQIYSSVIEDNVKIGPFCHIRPNCVIKSGVKIGDFVEVKNSNIGENTHASHLTYIGDSDVGKNVNFGCGTVTVNYDGIKKARCTVGDGAFIGCNTNLVAPVTIGEDGYTAAGSTITRDVPADSLAVSRAKEQRIIEHWVSKRKNRQK